MPFDFVIFISFYKRKKTSNKKRKKKKEKKEKMEYEEKNVNKKWGLSFDTFYSYLVPP